MIAAWAPTEVRTRWPLIGELVTLRAFNFDDIKFAKQTWEIGNQPEIIFSHTAHVLLMSVWTLTPTVPTVCDRNPVHIHSRNYHGSGQVPLGWPFFLYEQDTRWMVLYNMGAIGIYKMQFQAPILWWGGQKRLKPNIAFHIVFFWSRSSWLIESKTCGIPFYRETDLEQLQHVEVNSHLVWNTFLELHRATGGPVSLRCAAHGLPKWRLVCPGSARYRANHKV